MIWFFVNKTTSIIWQQWQKINITSATDKSDKYNYCFLLEINSPHGHSLDELLGVGHRLCTISQFIYTYKVFHTHSNKYLNITKPILRPLFQENMGKPAPERYSILHFNEARDDGWHWHQLDQVQIICTSLQTDNHASASSLMFYGPDALPAAQPTVSKHWKRSKQLA